MGQLLRCTGGLSPPPSNLINCTGKKMDSYLPRHGDGPHRQAIKQRLLLPRRFSLPVEYMYIPARPEPPQWTLTSSGPQHDRFKLMVITIIFTLTGWPILSVKCQNMPKEHRGSYHSNFENGLPVSVSKIAYACLDCIISTSTLSSFYILSMISSFVWNDFPCQEFRS